MASEMVELEEKVERIIIRALAQQDKAACSGPEPDSLDVTRQVILVVADELEKKLLREVPGGHPPMPYEWLRAQAGDTPPLATARCESGRGI